MGKQPNKIWTFAGSSEDEARHKQYLCVYLMEDNIFKRVAKALIRNGIIAGKAERFLLHLMSKSKDQLKYPVVHNKIMQIEDERANMKTQMRNAIIENELRDETIRDEYDTEAESPDVVISDLDDTETVEYERREELEDEVNFSQPLHIFKID